MKAFRPQLQRQRGAVAVMTALLLFLVLIPMSGLVLDLSHLYIGKAELQNMADAAALAAGRDLDNSATGITNAIATGKAIASKNRYNFSSTLTLADSNFNFAEAPDGPWLSAADAAASPTGLTFVRVNTSVGGEGGTPQQFDTYLMGIFGTTTTAAYGTAVAGRFVNTITPIGVCAIDPLHRTASYNYGTFTEVVEFGFRRGMAYNVFSLGSLGGATSDPYQINPVDAYPSSCKASSSSASSTAPFMCVGNSAVLPTGVGTVYTNTGMTASLDKALNSRFNVYGGGSVCDPTSAPPDVNIREYPCRGGGANCVTNAGATPSVTPPIAWMDSGSATYPNQQSVSVQTSGGLSTPKYSLPYEAFLIDSTKVWPSTVKLTAPTSRVTAPATFAEHGTLWAYTPAMQADGVTAITPAQANGTSGTSKMYGALGAATNYIDSTNYPTSVGAGFSTTVAAPYNQTGNGDYYLAPTGRTGEVDRRILNLVLIDCRSAPGGGGASCGTMTAVGIGKFCMLTQADFSGSPKRLDVEFTGLIAPVPTAEVKLYR